MSKSTVTYVALQTQFASRLETDLDQYPTLATSVPEEGLVRSMLKDLEFEFSLARERNDKIIVVASVEARKYLEEEIFEDIRNKYYKAYSKLYSLLPKADRTNSDDSNTTLNQSHYTHSELKLPKVELPNFSGAYEDWMAFNNMFTATVHNNVLMDPVVKLQRLKASLSGEAELVVRNLELNAANYTVARSLLASRYQHTRRLVNSYLKKIHELPLMKTESSKALKTMLNTLNDCCSALKQLGIDIENYNLIYHMCRKLPQSFLSSWEESQGSSTALPVYTKFVSFLETRFRMLEMIEPSEKAPKSFHVTTNPKQIFHKQKPLQNKRKSQNSTSKQVPNKQCIVCKANHKLGQCETFINLPQSEKLQAVKSNKSCINCLEASHTIQTCWSTRTCRVCKKKHHTLLHRYETTNTASNDSAAHTSSTVPPIRQNYHINSVEENGILLGTAQLHAVNPSGCSITIRALIDPCSEDSYTLSSTVQTLHLKKYFSPSTIGVLGEENATECSYRTDLVLKSIDNSFELKISAGIVNKITSNLPSVHVSSDVFDYFQELQLADTTFNEPGCIHMLLGVEVHTRIRLDQPYRLGQELIAENTLLGYLIRGKAPVNTASSSKVFMTKSNTTQLSAQIQKFWEIEELQQKTPQHPYDALCEEIFLSSIHQDNEGFLVMDLPFKDNISPDIGPSRQTAVRRFISLEKKLKSNPGLRNEYHKTINNYLSSDHLRQAPTASEEFSQQYFLPHHAVVKDSSSTTKVRVVFDASCKSFDGTSLNDHLLTGEKLQKDIRDVLFNWRQYPFALTADIEKMYRMFKVSPKHHNFQKIVWRFNENDPIQDFILTRATFGTSCAPFLALRSLRYIADVHDASSPVVSNSLRNEFYVDDYLSGGFSVNEALEKQTEIRTILQGYNLLLRKWSSNDCQTLTNVPRDLCESSDELVLDETEFKKTLGIFWSRDKDAFFFSINPQPESDCSFTKRQVLSLIARLYDPLGWVSPCTMLAKHLMQKIWQTKSGWDDVVEEPIRSQFKLFLEELPILRNFSVPRWTHITESNSPLTIFGFSDASDKGYSAVVYLMDPQPCKENPLILLTSKTKVADLKFQSTARLELNGAVLLSELLKWTVEMYKPRKTEVVAFCDSQIVLAWLQGHPSRWKTYIANRTSQILDWMDSSQWHYVDTKLNPADCASRGLMPSELVTHELWKNGPSIDQLNITQFNSLNEDQQKIFEDSIKKNSLVLHVKSSFTFNVLNKFSNHGKLVRVMTIVTNFIASLLAKLMRKCDAMEPPTIERHNKIITTLSDAEHTIFQCIQRECYQDEIGCLQRGTDLAKHSEIKGLSPFIDAHGLLRVGGRLQNTDLTFAQKHPIILPKKHQVVTNLIKDAHEKTMHGSELLTLAFLRQRYYIPRVSEKVRQYIHACRVCFRFSKQQQEFLMGTLPQDRVNLSRPFLHSGVDYAGPLTTKAYRGRCKKFQKSYIALFVCLCTKAIHLELVSELSSPAFLAAFKRFVGRRGRCQRLYSDNGTNFVGANRILQNDILEAQRSWKTDLEINFHESGTEWKFIPPSTPHFGGIWEAGVKSVKTHLKKTIGNSLLTFEELYTVLTQIEAVLNSRPLCPISDHPNEFNFLTPAHFLIGEALVAPPEANLEMDRRSHVQRWSHLQLSVQRFTKLWKRDYLNKLQNRPKWLKTTIEYSKGDLVLVADDDTPPTVWPTMIVEEVHPGTDNVVRVVTLRSPSGKTFKRPVTKLRRLPCNSSPEL